MDGPEPEHHAPWLGEIRVSVPDEESILGMAGYAGYNATISENPFSSMVRRIAADEADLGCAAAGGGCSRGDGCADSDHRLFAWD